MAKRKFATAAPRFELVCGDAVEYLCKAVKDGVAPRLIISDPPYNFGMEYADYHDSRPASEFMAWTESWLTAAARALHKHGSLWIFVPSEWVSEVDVFCKSKLKLWKRGHLSWFFTFGQACQNNFSRSHTHMLYYTRTKSQFTFNDAAVRVPSARQLVYKDKRANGPGKLPDDTWALLRSQLEPYLTPDLDTWLESRVCGTFKARRAHSPNQIPVPLLERVVLALTNPDDLVMDIFGGTFSSGLAALKHGRRFLGVDISPTCVAEGQRLLAAAASAK